MAAELVKVIEIVLDFFVLFVELQMHYNADQHISMQPARADEEVINSRILQRPLSNDDLSLKISNFIYRFFLPL